VAIDYQKHADQLTSFISKLTTFYLRTEASTGKKLGPNQGILVRNNYATPQLIYPLIRYLQVLTDDIDERLESYRTACLTAQMDLETCMAGDTTYGAIFTDVVAWKGRLAEYFSLTIEANKRDPKASGDADAVFWENVTQPLLLGWYPGEERQRRLDVVTPIIISHMIDVAKDAREEARAMFWRDLKDEAKKAGDIAVDVGMGVGAILTLALIGGAIAYGATRK